MAHYSLSLSSIFVLEYSFAHILSHHFLIKGDTKPMHANDLLAVGEKFSAIFSKEHLSNYKMDIQTLRDRLVFFAERKLIQYNSQTEEITLTGEQD